MSPNAIRYFLAVSRAGSFRRAADSLHIAASAVNRQIALLECDLGAALFERGRGRNQLRLTSAGEILLVHARAATGALEQARSEIEALKGLRVGTINLGAPETFAHDFLPDFLVDFHARFPRISFNISVATPLALVEQLLQDDIEVAMIYNPPPRAAIHIAAQTQKPTCAMVHAAHPLAKRASIRLADCASFPFVMPEYGTRAREMYDDMLGKEQINPGWAVTTGSYEMMRSMASAGLGIAIVSDYVVSRQSVPGAVFVPIRDCAPSVVACCTRRGRQLSLAASAFVERTQELFARLNRPRARHK
jgi:DNA-binding transcriptional LysR family regulator